MTTEARPDPPPDDETHQFGVLSHGWVEDLFALFVGSVFVVLGLIILHSSSFVTGGMAGAALLVSQMIPAPPGLLLGVLSVPFIVLAYISIGPLFALRTVAVSIIIALLSMLAASSVQVTITNPLVAAVVGGTLLGQGILIMVRHGAGMGGFGVLVFWLNRRFGWSIGLMQVSLDIVVLGLSAFIMWGEKLAWSGASALVMGLVVYLCHRPGRYVGISRMSW